MAEVTRQEHLKWCKQRALEYVDMGDLQNAVTSMISDLRKHPETDSPANGFLMMAGMQDAQRGNINAVRGWIEGFN